MGSLPPYGSQSLGLAGGEFVFDGTFSGDEFKVITNSTTTPTGVPVADYNNMSINTDAETSEQTIDYYNSNLLTKYIKFMNKTWFASNVASSANTLGLSAVPT